MGKWDNVPNEILDQILYKVKRTGHYYWKSINKQWFDMFLSMKYDDIYVKLSCSDAKLNFILDLKFQPRLCIK